MLTIWDQFLQNYYLKKYGLECYSFWLPTKKFANHYFSHVKLFGDAKHSELLGYGFGVDRNKGLSMTKAIFEASEMFGLRTYLGKEAVSRNGVAANQNKDIATQSARNELLERHTVLIHWYFNLPGKSLKVTEDLKKDIRAAERETATPDLLPYSALLDACPEKGLFVVGMARPSNFGCWYSGFGTSTFLELAISKAFREYLMDIYIHHNNKTCNAREVMEGRITVDSNSLRFAFNHHTTSRRTHSDRLLNIFTGKNPHPAIMETIQKSSSRFSESFTDTFLKSLIPGSFTVRTQNPLLIDPIFGDHEDPKTRDYVNKILLELNKTSEIAAQVNIEDWPHPIH